MKKYLMILTAAVMVLMLAACGSSSEAPSQDEAPAGEQEPAAEEEETAAPEVNPYAWLGFQDIPECDYMDALASNHYYKKSEVHIDGLSYVSKQINAVDGINTYKEDENSKVWSVGGKPTFMDASSERPVKKLCRSRKTTKTNTNITNTTTPKWKNHPTTRPLSATI